MFCRYKSSQIRYPGPSVLRPRSRRARPSSPRAGRITIPSRLGEGERIRRKQTAGLDFFTTQVLFDSNDIVWLIQQLNGVEARVFLSFAPVTHSKDIQFLRWLGADIPQHLDGFLLRGETAGSSAASNRARHPTDASDLCFERSLDLARRILMDVFDNLPPDPPPIGLNVEHINQRNFHQLLRCLNSSAIFTRLVAAHARIPVTDSIRPPVQDGGGMTDLVVTGTESNQGGLKMPANLDINEKGGLRRKQQVQKALVHAVLAFGVVESPAPSARLSLTGRTSCRPLPDVEVFAGLTADLVRGPDSCFHPSPIL